MIELRKNCSIGFNIREVCYDYATHLQKAKSLFQILFITNNVSLEFKKNKIVPIQISWSDASSKAGGYVIRTNSTRGEIVHTSDFHFTGAEVDAIIMEKEAVAWLRSIKQLEKLAKSGDSSFEGSILFCIDNASLVNG